MSLFICRTLASKEHSGLMQVKWRARWQLPLTLRASLSGSILIPLNL